MDSHASLIIINADIWTGDKANPRAEAIAVTGDKITYVGSSVEALQRAGNDTQVINAKNNFMTPGFIDSHLHFLMGGERLNSVKLKGVRTKQEFIEAIGEFAKKLGPKKWITGGDWDHMNWGGEMPDRSWIDKVTPNNPVWIGRHEGHTYLANTLALKLAGLLNSEITEPEGGTIERNSEGQLTGIFKDKAIGLVFTKIPVPEHDEFKKFLDSAMDYVIRNGNTSLHHMTEPSERNRGGNPIDLSVFEKLADRLRVRIYAAVPIENWKELAEKKKTQPNNHPYIKFGALKGYMDGSIGSHTCAMLEDFCDMPGFKGTMVNDPEKMFDLISQADKEDLQIFVHAIGDRGIHEILNVFERVIKANGPKDRRWRIEHAQHIHPSDIPRFRELGVMASVQPYHAIDDGRFVESMLGKERLKGTYAFRSLLDNGAVLAFGSDWFVAPPVPLITIHAAVNRIMDNGMAFIPEESVTVEEALMASTYWAAYSVHEENIKGTISVGKLADIVIMNQDLLNINPGAIRETRVLATIIGGKVEYQDKNFL